MQTVSTQPTAWEVAKANFNTACARLEQAGDAHSAMEREEQAFDATSPTCEVSYTASGFTIPDKMTLCPQERTARLTVNNYGSPSIADEVKALPEYAAFGVEREAWLEQREALSDARGWGTIESEWDAATDNYTAALHALIACPVATVADAGEKIALARPASSGTSLDGLDEDDLRKLVKALAADLERAGQRASDTALVEAWDRRKEAFAIYNALPFSEKNGEPYTPAEAAQWSIIDAAEDVICSTVAATPEGVAIQLWTQLSHNLSTRDDEAAVLRRDLAHFEAQGEKVDWPERLTLAAVRSLQAMEA